MCHIRWWEDYISFFDKRPDMTNVLLSLQSADSPGVLFTGFAEQETDNGSVSTFPVLCDGLSQNEYFVIQFIHNSRSPCIRGVPLIDERNPPNPTISSTYNSGGLQCMSSESEHHSVVISDMFDVENPSYSDIKREFDMV